MEEFPAYLGCPLNNLVMRPGASFIKTNFDHKTRYRKRYCETYLVDVQFIFDANQIVVFRRWHTHNLDYGVLPFMADWVIEGNRDPKEFHFYGPYTASLNQNDTLYRVSFTVELLTPIEDLNLYEQQGGI